MIPSVIYLCTRCRRGIVVFLGSGDEGVYEPSPTRVKPWCYTCGASDRDQMLRFALSAKG